jgi:diguanylate cyclase (GGDEF)-like protein
MEMLDKMTSTLTSDFFKFLLDSEGKRAMRYTYFFSVLTIEIDQPENEEILSTLAELIRQCIRNTDVIGMIDDEKFSVVLHHAEAQNTHCVGERIRDRVQNYNFAAKNNQQKRTVSVGGACFPTHTPDIQGLLLTANEMLARARSTGGNKVFLPEMDSMLQES